MKKINMCLIVILLLLNFTPMQLSAENDPVPAKTAEAKRIESAEVEALLIRLNDIKTMDRSNLSASEKKELRKEVREAKKQMKKLSGGVYLSTGAIIIIILLLILIL